MKVHLVSARWSNYPWGFGNSVFVALEDLGCEIVDTDFRVERNRLPSLLRQPCDLMLVLKGEGIPPGLIEDAPCTTVLWYPDDLRATKHGKIHIGYNGPAFDLVYGFAKYDLDDYRKLGVKDVRWLPLACNPRVHRKLDLPKVHDLCFVGNIYSNRATLLERLGRCFDLFVTRAYADKMVRIFNQSKIVLNLGIGAGGIQHRVFEALASGSLLLTNELPPNSRLFENRRHLVYYNEDNIEDLIAYYLKHEEEREGIAEAGRQEAIAKHTVTHRIRQILEDIDV